MRRLWWTGFLVSLSAFVPAAEYISFQSNVPESAERLRVPLEITQTRSGHSSSDTDIKPGSVPAPIAAAAGPEFDTFWDFGSRFGANYYAAGRTIPDLKVLGGQAEQSMLLARIFRHQPNDLSTIEEVTSGVVRISSGNSIEIPIKLTVGSIGTNKETSLQGILSVRPSTNNNQLGFYVHSRLNIQAAGSALLSTAKLAVTLPQLTSTTLTNSDTITLNIEPFQTGTPPRTVSGKLTDVLDLRGAKVVVDQIASDLSEIVLAVVQGNLEEAAEYQATLVSSLPPMAQVELFERRMVTDSDLVAAAEDSNGILMIFGEFKEETNPHMHYSGQQQKSNLPLSESAILNILEESATEGPAPRIIFVVRQISTKRLYEDYLGKKPPFDVLSDYSDVMRVQVRGAAPGHYFSPGNPVKGGTLREAMGLPDGQVSLVMLDKSGKVVYSKVDIGEDLTTPLVEARRSVSGQASESQ